MADDDKKQGYVLRVRVVEGKKLANKDVIGKSDPYVIVKLSTGENYQTRVIKNSLNPVWGQFFDFYIPPKCKLADETLTFTMWDKDKLTKDDFMGRVVAKGVDKTQALQFFKLEGKGAKGEVSLAWEKVLAHPSDDPSKKYALLTVHPIEAQDLTGKKWLGLTACPQLNMWLKGWNITTYQTPPPLKDTKNPTWPEDYQYTFVLGEEDDEKAAEAQIFQSDMWNFNKIGKMNYMGSTGELKVGTLEWNVKQQIMLPLEALGKYKDEEVSGNVVFEFLLHKGPHPPPLSDALAVHVRFFDWNGDGIITEDEVEKACRQMGLSKFMSWILSKTILPLLPTDQISQLETGTRHPDANVWRRSDGTFDEDGFQQWFYESDTDHSGGLSTWEVIKASWKISHNPMVFAANMGELQTVHLLLAEHGELSKKNLHDFLTGEFFQNLIASRRRELQLGYHCTQEEPTPNTPHGTSYAALPK